jgi:hypothetical protein
LKMLTCRIRDSSTTIGQCSLACDGGFHAARGIGNRRFGIGWETQTMVC